MQRFLGQGSNLCHCSDNAASLTPRPPGNSETVPFKKKKSDNFSQEVVGVEDQAVDLHPQPSKQIFI